MKCSKKIRMVFTYEHFTHIYIEIADLIHKNLIYNVLMKYEYLSITTLLLNFKQNTVFSSHNELSQ